MNGNNDATTLLAMAERDHRALQGMIGSSYFSDEIFGFHAQQAAEKALKAWLSLLGHQYPHSHDLSLLEHLLENAGVDMRPWMCLLELGVFGVQFRYETLAPDEEPINRTEIIERTGALIALVSTFQSESIPQ